MRRDAQTPTSPNLTWISSHASGAFTSGGRGTRMDSDGKREIGIPSGPFCTRAREFSDLNDAFSIFFN